MPAPRDFASRCTLFAAATVMACSSGTTTTTRVPVTSPPPPASRSPVVVVPGTFATATMRDLVGTRVGTVTFLDTYAGLLIRGTVSELGLGAHAIHIHAVGRCEPPFATAGPHFNPGNRQHGFKNQKGWHLGDLPNIDTPASGRLTFELVLPDVSLRGKNALLDGDGAAIIIHASRDDLLTDPAGDSGARAACGVITLTR
ncbi:MAG TPA: superoxide dismutase family protein [Gemmatimonadaceae bacterium]|nr:superoxide dismutase family protein [Gemmatimonadaceae bacterium]